VTTPINFIRLIDKITAGMHGLTPKGRILGEYIITQPRKAVFMTTKELAEVLQGE
jgi:DNA-binding MurR/RpiR family transcriptional regulator